MSEAEKQASADARFDVFPDDVRKDVTAHQNFLVAWAGVIQSAEFVETEANVEIHFAAQHHYFDWIEDHSVQRAVFFLSPRGEGTFTTVWPIRKEVFDAEIREAARVGNMIVVYGTVEAVDGSIVRLHAAYVRTFPAHLYSTEALIYGRPGEPVQTGKVLLR